MTTFKRLASHHIESLNLTLHSYQHQTTGALHHHFETDAIENVFMVAFRTIPQDSTGVAHILEHTVLCGSKRFPVRDPFFMMIRRSLNTFMNAFTASDWTAYPFASCNKKDFFNLLDVYLDSAFFPTLDASDFAQEGWRYDFEESKNPSSKLVYKGVVFNEMKGAMSTQTRALWHTLCKHLYPSSTYHYNSGGDPKNIPELTHQQLVDFHRQYYHPSNAIFFTYGNNDPSELQMQFEAKVLSQFDHAVATPFVTMESPLPQPLEVTETYAFDEEDPTDRSHIVLSWLLGDSTDIDRKLEAYLLAGVLLDNSAAPLRKALETSDLGQSPSPICGLEDEHRQMQFTVGLEGCNESAADAVQALVFDIFDNIQKSGVDSELVEAVLHQLELSQREVGGDGYPYGLSLSLNALTTAIHGGDIAARLDLDSALDRLRDKCQSEQFIPSLISELLTGNQHRVRLTFNPDKQLSQQLRADERTSLDLAQQSMSQEEKQSILEFNQLLEQRQSEEQDMSILPKVDLEDIPLTITEPTPTQMQSEKNPAFNAYTASTNGLIYVNAVLPLDLLSAEQCALLPWLSSVVPELGSGQRDYLQTQAAIARYTGGINASVSVNSQRDDINQTQARFQISAKGLARNTQPLIDLIQDSMLRLRFDESQRMQELMAQWRFQTEQSIVSQGHIMAMNAASHGFNAQSQLQYEWSGMKGAQQLIQQHQAFNATNSKTFLAQLETLYHTLNQINPNWLLISDESHLNALINSVNHTAMNDSSKQVTHAFLPEKENIRTQTVWSLSTQVNYCAKAFPAVTSGHPDAPALSVLANFLRNGFLHTAIREQGGSYGGGAQFDSSTASFRFFSYRDPRLQATLNDFDQSIRWCIESQHSTQALEEAILNAIAKIDTPLSPSGEVKKAYFSQLDGRDLAFRSDYRKRILSVTLEDLKRVSEMYLSGEASTAILTSKSEAEKLIDQGYCHEMLVTDDKDQTA